MRPFRTLWSFLPVVVLAGTLVAGGASAAVPRGWHAAILYTADERGEVTPCG